MKIFLLITLFSIHLLATCQNGLIVTSHRGSGISAENTLVAIENALKNNAIRIEIDIHLSADKQLVVMHDKKVNRTTTGKGRIKKLDYSYIKSLPIIYQDNVLIDVYAPTLDEVIDYINGKAILLIEIKGNYEGIENQLLELLEKKNALSWCIVQSFNDNVLKSLNSYNPDLLLHKLFIGRLFGINIKCNNLDEYPYISEFSCHYKFATKSLLKEVHFLDKRLNVFTVNKRVAIEQLINLGVDGIITDRPDIVYEVLNKVKTP